MNPAVLALEDGTVFEGRVLVRPSNERAKSSSIPRSPATRKSSPILPIPARSWCSPIRRSATTARTTADNEAVRSRISKAWWCASFRRFRATGGRTKPRSSFWTASRRAGDHGHRHARAGAASAIARRHARRAVGGLLRIAKELVETARQSPSMAGLDLATRVSTRGTLRMDHASRAVLAFGPRSRRCAAGARFHVVAYDFGIKRNILRRLVQVGLPPDGGSGGNYRRRRAGAETRRRVSFERSRRSRAARRIRPRRCAS